MSEIIARDASQLVVSTAAKRYIGESKSASTLRVYQLFLQQFENYCHARAAAPLPASPVVVADYIAHLADDKHLKPASISSQLSAIKWAHRIADVADPTTFKLVRETLSGIKRALGTAPEKKDAATLDDLRAMVATLDLETVKGLRDRALLLVGFAGAFRRSELVALDVADLSINGDLTISIRRSKTDQTGTGKVKTVPRIGGDLCPVAALESWLDAAGISSGAVFRRIDRWGTVWDSRLSSQTVALVVKAAARDAGLDARKFAGHSLRSGFVTSAFDAGASIADVKQVTHHESDRVLLGYHQNTGTAGKRAIKLAFAVESEPD